jgi:hypothetical protein
MAAPETGVAAAGQYEVCYLRKGYGVKSGAYANRIYSGEQEAIEAARKSLAEGVKPIRGCQGLAYVDEAHMRFGAGPWRLIVDREQPKRSALSVGAESFLPALSALRS